MTNEIKEVKKEEFIIPIDSISKDFKEHLNIENNNNLLFSGKFGLGKTYFLKDFFKNNKNYEVFHLFPINYQISSSEDIVDLLKYDILIELFDKNKNKNIFKDNKIEDFVDFSNMLYLFGKENKLEILKVVVGFFGKLGRPLKDTVGLFEKIRDFKEENEKGEKGIVDDFLKKIKKNSITENDFLSELIKDKINITKKDKKSVLVLDDLDRMDPEHIFRIMNVFGAHFNVEHKKEINKFGFDKIILVGDYDNLKSIFHHKYGIDTDFRGYIDKFYSIEIYFFDNSLIIKNRIRDIIQYIKYGDDYFKGALEKDTGYIKFILKEILEQSVLLKTNNSLSIRELLKGTKCVFSYLIRKKDYIRKSERLYIFETSLNILKNIFGGKKSHLINILYDIKQNYLINEYSYSESYYRYIIFDFINELYSKNDIGKKGLLKEYISYFEEDNGYIRVKSIIKEKLLIDLFYSVIIEYIEKKL